MYPIFLKRVQGVIITLLGFFLILNFACNGDNPTEPGEGTEQFEVAKIARWDGSNWTYLGDRIELQGEQTNYDKRGYAVAVSGNDAIYHGDCWINYWIDGLIPQLSSNPIIH